MNAVQISLHCSQNEKMSGIGACSTGNSRFLERWVIKTSCALFNRESSVSGKVGDQNKLCTL